MSGARGKAKGIEPIDVQVGRRVRAYRLSLGMSQATLGEKVGVTFQQIQKYELGRNRIAGSRLEKLATVLGVRVGALFAEAQTDKSGRDLLTEIAALPDAARLLKAFAGISDKRLRFSLVRLAEGLRKRAK